jgi:hypothetical protein
VVGADGRHINRNRVNDRCGLYSRNLILAPIYPKAGFPMVRYLDGLDPFGLLHSV